MQYLNAIGETDKNGIDASLALSIYTLSSASSYENASNSTTLILPGIYTFLIEAQLWNAPCDILLTFPRLISVRFGDDQKANVPIVSNVLPQSTLTRLLKSSKISLPIYVIPSLITTLLMYFLYSFHGLSIRVS